MSNINDGIRCAFDKGYYVTEEGEVIGVRGYVLRTRLDTSGYPTVSVGMHGYKGRERYVCRFRVSRLVAFQKFSARALDEGVHTRHLNGDKLDSRPTNIAIGTASDNAMDRSPEVRSRAAQHASSVTRRFTDSQVQSIRHDRDEGMTYAQLKQKYGASKSTLSYLFNKAHY